MQVSDDLLAQIGLEKAKLRWMLKNSVYITSAGKLKK